MVRIIDKKTFNQDGYRLLKVEGERIGYGTYLRLLKPGTSKKIDIFLSSQEVNAIIRNHQMRYPNAQVWKNQEQRRKMRGY